VKALLTFNRASSLPWYLNGKILRRRTFGLLQIKMVNWLTPLFRLIDGWLPFPPLSLIAVLEPRVSLEAGAASLDVSRERAAGA
jgi:hypothetical protein